MKHPLQKRINKTIEWLSGFDSNGQQQKLRKSKDRKEFFDDSEQSGESVQTGNEPKLEYDFVILYYEEPDETGHDVGPDDENITRVLKVIDASIGISLLLYSELIIFISF